MDSDELYEMEMDGEVRWHGSCRPAVNDARQLIRHSFGAKEAAAPGSDLWTGGLVCAFELVRGHAFASPPDLSRNNSSQLKDLPVVMDSKKPPLAKNANGDGSDDGDEQRKVCRHGKVPLAESYWAPIGWTRIAELVEMVDGDDTAWNGQGLNLMDGDGDGELCCGDITVADVATHYWQRPAGPTWWCHVTAGHPAVDAWLATARWLHPAVCIALRDESMLISEKMKHLLYERLVFQVPVRVSGGLLFELLGQSVGDPTRDEDDIPIVIRAWQAQNFLITTLHVKGSAPNINVSGVTEVQELLSACGSTSPKSIHEVIAHLASRLARWDDRLWRKYVFGAADEIELKFVNRRNQEDLNLLCIIFNQDIRRLATQDKSLRVTHNLTIFGGCGLILSIITGLFGINVDGIPGAENTPYAFALFSGLLFLVGFLLIIVGIVYFGLQKPISDQQIQVRKLELQQLVSMFQHEAETHVKVREGVLRSDLPPRAADLIYDKGTLAFYLSVKKLGRYFSFEAKNEPTLQGYHLVSFCTL
ncbi:hypothetical protein BAE44_0017646 [Dichanthelium oligosanthes]|uniref:Magnesium transporter CorA-like family protein n=1 Tax=Dichanthelium oligosanthes TaxID=888268 RepID=A0A1E5V8I4_9POAL|nr:hypothetical protein BAE44_0017646 [Dichanthelium oligosanthes]